MVSMLEDTDCFQGAPMPFVGGARTTDPLTLRNCLVTSTFPPGPSARRLTVVAAFQSINARIRKAVKARGQFPTEQAALKCVNMALMSLDPTGPAASAGPTGGSWL
jgi:Transposase, Mutator family